MFGIDTPPPENFLGLLALLSYVITLTPSVMRIVFPHMKKTGIPKALLKQRRCIGVLAFLLAIIHGWILVRKRDIDFMDPRTSWIYFQGIATMAIFAILAATSNDWSVRALKKNWKKLHRLTYLALFLLTWHVWDKMSDHWTYVTPISMIAILCITALSILRLWREKKASNQVPRSPCSSPQALTGAQSQSSR
ncbi:Sulfoxide reductase heme-binding subunit YedZ [Acaryochloris thomasi RCC1774]|uniref:Sulfoxide reductase heme-binding subunit YedZ n=1 Tax=Acaryochloris thomasi RCC1774 TaxID=1764569 RepID=A0A2W1J8R8_9CYAN|nr:ferric reductase-like transmembrane domain-containing protein [Acaryochloris thomasi]PZD70739.1 Sulfoxide reductase heme-binding subunit YedZ [Acaryochloris thomasi RCC1774]